MMIKAGKPNDAPIPKKELEAFYKEVGRTIVEFFDSLECPVCGNASSIDWILEKYSVRPEFVCRNCCRTFPIKGLKFRKKTSLIKEEKTQPTLKKVNGNKALPIIDIDKMFDEK